MKFSYKRYHTLERPVVPIVIRNPQTGLAVGYEALIDSGSDLCIFSSEIGELVGLDVLSGEAHFIGGVVAGERRPYYLHAIEISIGGQVYTTSAAFMPDLSKSGHGLLGRAGFFDRFSFVKFRQPQSTIEIGRPC